MDAGSDSYSKVCESDSKNTKGLAGTYRLTLVKSNESGGVDGTRTRDPRRDRPMPQAIAHAGFGPSGYSKDRPIRAVPSLEAVRAHSKVFGGFARSIKPRSQSTPCASTLAHWRGFRRIERSTSASSGGVGGRPGGRFGCSMRRF
jgi:hypothetical protein